MNQNTKKLLKKRIAARERLLAQIESGVKTVKITDETGIRIEKVPLSEHDTKRVSQEIVALDFYISGGKKKKKKKNVINETSSWNL